MKPEKSGLILYFWKTHYDVSQSERPILGGAPPPP